MSNIWLTEQLHPFLRVGLNVQRILVDERSAFQRIQVLDVEFFGRTLVLDGIIQITERDNAGYHEMMVHVPALAVGTPRRALVIGGGDGAALAQVLRYPSVEEAVICELDRRVVEVCREYFPAFAWVWDDPRTRLVVQDAFEYMRGQVGSFDVIVADTTDPLGMAERLFSEEFYSAVVKALAPGGAASAMCEQPMFNNDLIVRLYRFAKTLVKCPAYYYAQVPTYPGGGIGYIYMSDRPWQEGLGKPYPPGQNDYINPDIHHAAFALPEYFRRTLEGETA